MTPRHLMGEGRQRGPHAAYDENDHRRQVAEDHRAARHVVRPANEGDGERHHERQPEVDAERGGAGLLTLSLATFGLALVAVLVRGRLGRQAVEFALDLLQLERPVDFTQRILLPNGWVRCCSDFDGLPRALATMKQIGSWGAWPAGASSAIDGEGGTRRRVDSEVHGASNRLRPPCLGSPAGDRA